MRNPISEELAKAKLFKQPPQGLSWLEHVRLSYEKARVVVHAYRLTADDILHLSPKYWQFHTDPVLVMDGAVGTLLTIHYNLCSGTLAMFAAGRPDISRVLCDLLDYRLSGQYCLTELGHGLGVINLETTVTEVGDGQFELHTPVERAAKYMPPTVPCGIPCVAIVFARLIIRGEDRGIKPFLVPLHDGENMSEGVVCKPLSARSGAHPVDHALTYFNHVRLPRAALLGEETKAADARSAFFYNISRVISGTLSMGAFGVSAMRVASCVAGRYSLRRMVIDVSKGIPRPVISFSTQYLPISVAISQTMIMRTFADALHSQFADSDNLTMKHFIAAVFKTTVYQHVSNILPVLGDRCGAQGLFEVNQISALHANTRGAAIAEGDILGISIRFAIEVILGRLESPPPRDKDYILARHEAGLIQELRQKLLEISDHRSAKAETMLLPHCQGLIESIGHRWAVDEAIERGVDPRIVQCYIASVMCLDESWYVEHGGWSRWSLRTGILDATMALYPDLEHFISSLEADIYVTAPIVSDQYWNSYVSSLQTLAGPAASSSPGRTECIWGGQRGLQQMGHIKAVL